MFLDLNYRLVSSNEPKLFGALVMRVLQPTNLNTIEPVILKVRPVELSGEPWWSTMMTLVMVSLFDQFVPFSSFEWKAKIWIGSHLILQYYFSRKGLISQQPMRIQDFLGLWLDDENSNSMLKNRICPGNKPRLFWVTFKLMIFQDFENFQFFFRKFKKFCEIDLVKLPEFPGLLLLLFSIWIPSFLLVDFLATGWQHFILRQ